ncbi:MAG: hypothetical protein ACOY3I_05465 [Verrucomicrobiota bacterium]
MTHYLKRSVLLMGLVVLLASPGWARVNVTVRVGGNPYYGGYDPILRSIAASNVENIRSRHYWRNRSQFKHSYRHGFRDGYRHGYRDGYCDRY